jgi:hypothetical protein
VLKVHGRARRFSFDLNPFIHLFIYYYYNNSKVIVLFSAAEAIYLFTMATILTKL